MQRVLKKNYTLYADYSGKRVKLYSGTLEEIDDFTTYFVDKNAIRKREGMPLSFFKILSPNIDKIAESRYNFVRRCTNGRRLATPPERG